MKQKNLFSSMIRDYFIIFSFIIIVTALLNPSHAFTYREIMLAALFAFAGDLPSLVTYSRKELSEKSRYIRMILHFVLLEVVILIFGNIIGQVAGLLQNTLLALEVLGIYILVIFITWLIDRKTANDINQQLANLRLLKKE